VSADFQTAVQLYRDRNYGEAAAAFADLARDEPDPGRAAVLHADAGRRAPSRGEAIWHPPRRACSPRPGRRREPVALVGEGSSEAAHQRRCASCRCAETDALAAAPWAWRCCRWRRAVRCPRGACCPGGHRAAGGRCRVVAGLAQA
jgi:hypothetical protein